MTLVFLDTETTSLRPDRRAWEIAAIVRDRGTDTERTWMVEAYDLDLGNADLNSLKIGKFYDRHPSCTKVGVVVPECRVLNELERLTCDIYAALSRAGHIQIAYDEDGYVNEFTYDAQRRADKLIDEAIQSLAVAS